MASDSQFAANRANAGQSTGPKTTEGKGASSRNAIRHGLTSRATLLPGEDPEQFLALRQDIVSRLAPVGALEAALAENVATTLWKYLRMETVESAYIADRVEVILADHPDQPGDGFMVVAGLFGDNEESQKLNLVLRYLTSARNAHEKAIRAFQKAQQERIALSVSTAAAELASEPMPETMPKPHSASAAIPYDLTRAERRAIERAQRKAAKRANRSASNGIGFVSQKPDGMAVAA